MMKRYHRDDVFVAGGQPTVTYVERSEVDAERMLARALATPNQIAALAGPTKTGKTVLCRKVLGSKEYVWIDGGQVSSAEEFWLRVASELALPDETIITSTSETSGTVEASSLVITANGSHLKSRGREETKALNSVGDSINLLTRERITLVIDDFHYLEKEARSAIIRNLKGAVFNGLKVLLLSVTHRVYDAIKAETEMTGRFVAVLLPDWDTQDLARIANEGFKALRVSCPLPVISRLSDEAQHSPFLMQKFCWELCYDCNIESTPLLASLTIPADYDLESMFARIAKDAGLPIYQQLAAGPQIRKARAMRPLKAGGEADIYKVTLLAIAETGPKAVIRYDELRASMNNLLSEMMPQKNEITSALKHLSSIARQTGTEAAIDWDEDKREINVVDPYLRFYLRWQVRQRPNNK